MDGGMEMTRNMQAIARCLTITLAVAGVLAAAVASHAEEAQEDTLAVGDWRMVSDISVTLNQSSYSDNWTGGESGALSWQLGSTSLAEGRINARLRTESSLMLAFGQTHSQDKETKRWARPAKSTDVINFETVARLTYGWIVDPFLAARIESQFMDDSDAGSTQYLDPATFTESVGVAKTLAGGGEREWKARLGGALRQHVDRYAPAADTDERETVWTQDAGMEFVTELRTPLAGDRVSLVSRLALYKAFFFSEQDELEGTPGEDDWKSPDIDWQNTLTASITEYLNVSLYVQLLFDKEVVDALRVQEGLSLGLAVRLP
jgi:hypothetical protein